MFDELHSEGLDHGRKRERPTEAQRPLADREVPLGPPSAVIAESVHAWLDGELTESHARRADARNVEFWNRLEEDLAARRRLRTPVHLQAQIMNALPMHPPQLITPWWRREFVVTPTAALAVAATLVAITAAATAFLIRVP